jgi:hypothetical protein
MNVYSNAPNHRILGGVGGEELPIE